MGTKSQESRRASRGGAESGEWCLPGAGQRLPVPLLRAVWTGWRTAPEREQGYAVGPCPVPECPSHHAWEQGAFVPAAAENTDAHVTPVTLAAS